MRVLRYENRKSNPVIYDISTPEKCAAGYLRMFKILDEVWECYSDLEEVPVYCDACTDGQHQYCRGSSCACKVTPTCKALNRGAVERHENNTLQHRLYTKAKEDGDWKAAKRLMDARRNYEYESVREDDIEIRDPMEGSR